MNQHNFLAGVALWLGLLVVAFAYWPGAQGDFLLDDWSNLPSLGSHGGIVNLPTLLLYLSSGVGDTIGRPLTLLSFLIDDHAWPSIAAGFKRTGILIHLLNGALLCWATYRLGLRARYNERIASRAAVLSSMLWLGHPLLVSTTLYIVQRATLLATTFFLLAVLAWDKGWRALENQRLYCAWQFGFGLVVLATTCSVLSKANGALTPLLLALIYCLFYKSNRQLLPKSALKAESRIHLLAISIPSAAVIVAMILTSIDSFTQVAGTRSWSLVERTLSQPRALLDYVYLLLVPRVGSRGVFTDDFAISRGLLEPESTAIALLAILCLAYLTWRYRKTPPLALAIGFFLLGHSLESGFINLELYYEHRNYLPAIFLFWPAALWLLNPSENLIRSRLLFSILLPIVLFTLTFQRALLWSSNENMARVSIYQHPASLRAQLYLSSLDIAQRNYYVAEQRLQAAIQAQPAQPLLTFNFLHIQCLTGHNPNQALAKAKNALLSTKVWEPGFYSWLSNRLQGPTSGVCQQLRPEQLKKLIDALAENQYLLASVDARQSIRALRGELALAQGDWQTGLNWFNQSLAQNPSLESCLWLAYRHADYGMPELGAQFLQTNTVCQTASRIQTSGMGKLHQLMLGIFPDYDQQRNDLKFALSNNSLSGPDSNAIVPINTSELLKK